MNHNYVNKLTTLEPKDYVYKNIFEFKERHKIKNDIIEKIWKENFSSNKSKCPNCNIYPICKPFSSCKQGVHGKFTPHSLIVKKKLNPSCIKDFTFVCYVCYNEHVPLEDNIDMASAPMDTDFNYLDEYYDNFSKYGKRNKTI